MNIRIIKKDGKAYVELPTEFSHQSELELFQLKDGYYLLSLPLGSTKTTQQKTRALEPEVNDAERALLEKLLSIRFEQRTPKELERSLSTEEKKLLKILLDRDHVNIFRSKKYPDGVYNISDEVYASLRQGTPKQEKEFAEKTVAKPQSSSFKEATDIASDAVAVQLQRQGFAVLMPNAIASDTMCRSVRAGEVIGVKSFDGRAYAVTKEYFSRVSNIIKSLLKKESTVDEIARFCKTPSEGCTAVLAVMAERGEVLERKKNVFALV